MANFAAVKSDKLNNQGIRSVKKIEWLKATVAAAVATDTISYTLTEIKTVSGLVGCQFSYSFNSTTRVLTITIPYAISAGTFHIGVVEG